MHPVRAVGAPQGPCPVVVRVSADAGAMLVHGFDIGGFSHGSLSTRPRVDEGRSATVWRCYLVLALANGHAATSVAWVGEP